MSSAYTNTVFYPNNWQEKLNTPLNDDSVLFPENLQVTHDNAMNTLYLLEREIEEQQYQLRKNN